MAALLMSGPFPDLNRWTEFLAACSPLAIQHGGAPLILSVPNGTHYYHAASLASSDAQSLIADDSDRRTRRSRATSFTG